MRLIIFWMMREDTSSMSSSLYCAPFFCSCISRAWISVSFSFTAFQHHGMFAHLEPVEEFLHMLFDDGHGFGYFVAGVFARFHPALCSGRPHSPLPHVPVPVHPAATLKGMERSIDQFEAVCLPDEPSGWWGWGALVATRITSAALQDGIHFFIGAYCRPCCAGKIFCHRGGTIDERDVAHAQVLHHILAGVAAYFANAQQHDLFIFDISHLASPAAVPRQMLRIRCRS